MRARAALGGGGSLSEKSFIDANTTIGAITSHASGATAGVDVDYSTRKGPASEHFVVSRNADGPVITSHVASGP